MIDVPSDPKISFPPDSSNERGNDSKLSKARSNGLAYTRQRMRGQGFSAHVTLSRGERSDLAEAGASLM